MTYLVTYWSFDDGLIPECVFTKEEDAKEYIRLRNEKNRKRIEDQGLKYDPVLDKRFDYETITLYQSIEEATDDLPYIKEATDDLP